MVILSGWVSANGWSIDEQCRFLITGYVSQEAATAAIIRVSDDLKCAVLDFRSLVNGSQQAASTAANLDGVEHKDFMLRAKVVLRSDAAYAGRFSGK